MLQQIAAMPNIRRLWSGCYR